jgi:2-polyprenyl-6-hydroxyphenyl methylase/3-demethylubiquinone-9 3-methyltransferase
MDAPGTTGLVKDADRGDTADLNTSGARFLAGLDDARVDEACRSLRRMLGIQSLAKRSFLDVGSGNGLYSLAAMRLGAARVVSFDHDPHSVACGRELKRRYFPSADNWTIEAGNVLDGDYLARLGSFDVVYSFGVLHQTGKLWDALANVAGPVAPGGRLFIAVYRDQGWVSRVWLRVKQIYNLGPVGRALVTAVFLPFVWVQSRFKRSRRSALREWIDWLGRLPFEVASAPAVLAFYKLRRFRLENLELGVGHGCNEFVFSRSGTMPPLVPGEAPRTPPARG